MRLTEKELILRLYRRLHSSSPFADCSPCLTRRTDLTHSYGVRVFYALTAAPFPPHLPDLLEAWVDVLNLIHWRCAA